MPWLARWQAGRPDWLKSFQFGDRKARLTLFFCYKCGTNHRVSFRSSLDWSMVGVGQRHSSSSSDTIADPSAKCD